MANVDTVRDLIGDDEATELLTDAKIQGFIDRRSVLNSSGGTVSVNLEAAAADAAGAIAAKFARKFNFSEDSQRFDLAQQTGNYLAIERELRNRSGGVAVPLGGTLTT